MKTGIRSIEPLEDGAIAWLHPGGADLDEVLVEYMIQEGNWVLGEILEADDPTVLPAEVSVGYYRRMPWCHCGDSHLWHVEDSEPGRGASLGIGYWTG